MIKQLISLTNISKSQNSEATSIGGNTSNEGNAGLFAGIFQSLEQQNQSSETPTNKEVELVKAQVNEDENLQIVVEHTNTLDQPEADVNNAEISSLQVTTENEQGDIEQELTDTNLIADESGFIQIISEETIIETQTQTQTTNSSFVDSAGSQYENNQARSNDVASKVDSEISKTATITEGSEDGINDTIQLVDSESNDIQSIPLVNKVGREHSEIVNSRVVDTTSDKTQESEEKEINLDTHQERTIQLNDEQVKFESEQDDQPLREVNITPSMTSTEWESSNTIEEEQEQIVTIKDNIESERSDVASDQMIKLPINENAVSNEVEKATQPQIQNQEAIKEVADISISSTSSNTAFESSESVEEEIAWNNFERSVLSLQRQSFLTGSNTKVHGSDNSSSTAHQQSIQQPKTTEIPSVNNTVELRQTMPIPVINGSLDMDAETMPIPVITGSLDMDAETMPIPVITGSLDMDAETMQTIQNIKVAEAVSINQKVNPNKERESLQFNNELSTLSGEGEREELLVLGEQRRETKLSLFTLDDGVNTTSASLTEEQEQMLLEYMIEEEVVVENKATQDSSTLGYVRLGDLAISNIAARKNVVSTFTEMVKQVRPEVEENQEVWQKHSFELEDGNSIELTTRSVDGVIQVKIAASSLELNKILQQHLQDIKDHVRNELNQELDLQFEQNQNDELAQFFGDSSKNDQNEKKTPRSAPLQNEHEITENKKPTLENVVRKFGYNQMEWIG